MTPIKLLQLIAEELKEYHGCYAVAGGLAASFYRAQPRLTNDADIAFCVGTADASKETAKALLERIGLIPAMGWIASQDKMKDPIALVIGRTSKEGEDELESTVDILLPVFPWVEKAIERAQSNMIDFGFAKLPTATPEDLIIAKAFALSIEKNRFTDMDDIQSILKTDNQLDFTYLANELDRLQLSFPKELQDCLPDALRRLSKRKNQAK